MLESVTIGNFKSFARATLTLSPVTLLVGANASGKSNAIEALQLLSWLASGRRLGDVLVAIREQELGLRGTFRDLARQGEAIKFQCEVGPLRKPPSKPGTRAYSGRLVLSILLQATADGLRIVEEKLESPDLDSSHVPLYEVVEPASKFGNELQVAYNNFARGGKKPRITCVDQQAVFTQLATPARFAAEHKRSQEVIPAAADRLRGQLEDILFLDPVPRSMRGYAFVQEKKLQGDGAALSSVLYRLVEEEGRKQEVLDFVRSLPEQDIQDITFLETPRSEVMVQLHETFGGRPVPCDAALLSDGTLRVLAVAAALLSVPEGSTVVIEEIDNGVHPSRAELLLSNLRRVAEERDLRVLLTTHNPALLDAIPPESVPDTVACWRDPEQGDSRLIRLEELATYPELVAQGPVGRLVTKGILDRFLKSPEARSRELASERGLAWLSEFQARHLTGYDRTP